MYLWAIENSSKKSLTGIATHIPTYLLCLHTFEEYPCTQDPLAYSIYVSIGAAHIKFIVEWYMVMGTKFIIWFAGRLGLVGGWVKNEFIDLEYIYIPKYIPSPIDRWWWIPARASKDKQTNKQASRAARTVYWPSAARNTLEAQNMLKLNGRGSGHEKRGGFNPVQIQSMSVHP